MTYSRAGGTGVTRVTFATPIFDRHVNPIPIKGGGGQRFSLSNTVCTPNNIDLPPALLDTNEIKNFHISLLWKLM